MVRPLFVDFEFLIRDFHRNNAGAGWAGHYHYSLFILCMRKRIAHVSMTKSPWIY